MKKNFRSMTDWEDEEWAEDDPGDGDGRRTPRGDGPSNDTDGESAKEAENINAGEGSSQSVLSVFSTLEDEISALTEEERDMLYSPGSLAWYYFEKSANGEKATCKVCKKTRSAPTGTTSTLKNHFKKLGHTKEYNQYCKLEKIRKKN
ncbi:Glycine--tRNA ligase beta subunit [Frankliniella fusca]|uniref:Glycine--tRNA ligase beta subunit n=1 Tax=Frankliniella fusca TaxID=407009 RepID=A0AAE1LLF3_9NEOP|nr:Glycine--tRNA ligase beta subunit [Frankliniella fusca]